VVRAVDPAGILPKFYKAYHCTLYRQQSFGVNISSRNGKIPFPKMLKVDADKTFSAPPPDLERTLWRVRGCLSMNFSLAISNKN
jgi:hypothetical protein